MANVGTINIGGLASGLDTQELIESLMEIDSQPLNRLESQKQDIADVSSVFASMKTKLLDFQTIASDLRSSSTLNAFSASSSDEEALVVSASSSADAGNYVVKILSLAQAEARSSNSFTDNDTGLGLSGEISVNGKSITVGTNDSLIDLRDAVNSLEAGVTANILKVDSSDYRLVLSAEEQGSQGFTLANVGGSGLLEELGFTDGTTDIREVANGAVLSSRYAASNATIGSMIGLDEDVAGTVRIRDQELLIDLASDTLASLRDKINNLGLTGVTAEIEAVEDDDSTTYRLAITGTTEFTDDNSVLETLGILTGGTSGIGSVFETGMLYMSESSSLADETTYLSQLGAHTGDITETISIKGYRNDGTSVSSIVTIDQTTTVGDLIDAVEEAFGGDVTASMVDGVLSIRSVDTGETALSVTISANNEDGGTLDFGVVSETVRGRSRVVVEGTDARLLVNNIRVTRTTNEINDVITGLTLNLKEADPQTALTITVDQDNSAIKEKITEFVDAFNEFAEYYNEQSAYDEENEEAGPLLGNLTARTAMTQLQSILQTTVNDQTFLYTQLAQIGIELTTEGTLDIDTSRLDDALNEDPEAVISLFTVTRRSSDDDIAFVYNSSKSAPGTYNVTITTAAEKASVDSQIFDDRLGIDGYLTLTDDLGAGLEIEYSADMTVGDLANRINEEAQTSYTKVLTSENTLATVDNTAAVSQSTSIGSLAGVTVEENDTITITGTKRSGASFQRVLTFTDGESYTVQDILNQIATLNSNEVTASLDSSGHIVVIDQKAGTSRLAVSIETTIDGLDFGSFITTQEGRTSVNVAATVSDDNSLTITHTAYGSAKSFTVEGGTALGISDGQYNGIDIAGTINGVAGTGKGTALTASTSDSSSRGIIINSAITAEELAVEGPAQGTITLVAGVAERMYSQLGFLTNSVDGFIQTQIDSYEMEQESINSQIENMTQRLEQRRALYVRRFTELEVAMSRLQSLQQQLTSSLSALQT